jgi:transaldolase
MSDALNSLIKTGTKLWLDSIDPDLIVTAKRSGATGATSNPIIVADLLKSGRFDDTLQKLMISGLSDDHVAWEMTDQLVQAAQKIFLSTWERSSGNDGFVSFELDPLIEDPANGMPISKRVARYVELGKKWAAGHKNRMIKVPATPAGLAALEDLTAAGISLNVTLIFSDRQYIAARDAIWRGAQKREDSNYFKAVYSIFVSRVDVYTQQHCPQLSEVAQGQVGILNSKRIWAQNQKFWADKGCPLDQEIVFASTGTKNPADVPWKYVEALAGSDIQTNPPATNDLIAASDKSFTRQVDRLPADEVIAEIDQHVDPKHLEETLMREGLSKFAKPQQELLKLIQGMRAALTS